MTQELVPVWLSNRCYSLGHDIEIEYYPENPSHPVANRPKGPHVLIPKSWKEWLDEQAIPFRIFEVWEKAYHKDLGAISEVYYFLSFETAEHAFYYTMRWHNAPL